MTRQIFSWLQQTWWVLAKRMICMNVVVLTSITLPNVAYASVIDTLLNIINPNKSRGGEPSTSSPADDMLALNTKANDVAQDNSTDKTVATPPPSKTPDLLTILQAEFAADRDDLQTALALYKAESFKKNATTVFERALSLSLQLESNDHALSFAKAWQDSNTDHVPVWFYVTHLALKSGDYATAAHNLKLILSYDPKADLSRIFSGIFPAKRADQQALFFALQSIGNDDNPSLSVMKAGLLNQFDEQQAAILYLNKAIDIEPNNLAFLMLKADMLQGAGKQDALQSFLQSAQQHTTGETQKQLYLYQIRGLIDQAKLEQAWLLLKNTHKKFPSDNELTLLASLVALDLKQYPDAIAYLKTLVAQPSYQAQANYYLGISYERQQNYPQALFYFYQVDGVDLVLNATKKIVAHQMQANDSQAAMAALVMLRKKYPLFVSESYTMQADILVKIGKTQEAKALLNQAAIDYPDDTTLLYAATLLLSDETDYVEKLDNIRTLLSFEPNNPRYLLEEARLILLKEHTNQQALGVITTISQLPLDDPDYDRQLQLEALMILANDDLTAGRFDGVIEKLQAVYEVKPTLAAGTLLLRAYQGLGEHDKVQALLWELTELFGAGNQDQKTTQDKPTAAPNFNPKAPLPSDKP